MLVLTVLHAERSTAPLPREFGASRHNGVMADNDRIRSIAVAVMAVVQTAVALGSQVVVSADNTNAAISADNRSPLTPAGYAFSIWGLIFLASLALAVYQLRPDQRDREVHRRTGWWLVAAFTASTLFNPVFANRILWLAELTVLALVVCLAVAARRFRSLGRATSRTEQLALRLPVTLYLGWATLASAAGLGAALRSVGMPERATWVTAVSLLVLLAIAVASVVAAGRLLAVAGFAFTACWALVAIAVATYAGPVRVGAVVALLLILVVLGLRTAKSRHPGAVLFG